MSLLFRSLLFVPAHRAGWARKAAASGADALIFDLEDAVPPDQKAAARRLLKDHVAEARASRASVGVVVRINGLGDKDGALDLEAVITVGADALMLPKVESADDVLAVDAVLSFLERRDDLPSRIRLIPTLETAAGIVAAAPIAAATRVGGLATGAANNGDTARSVGFRWSPTGMETLAFRSAVVLAARAAGAEPFIGLWQQIDDLVGLRQFAEDNRDLGYTGQCLIHPSHVGTVNEAFAPSEELLAYYKGMIESYESAAAGGRGALVYEGQHIDRAHVETARAILASAQE